MAPDRTAKSLALHAQAVIQGAFILAKAVRDKRPGTRPSGCGGYETNLSNWFASTTAGKALQVFDSKREMVYLFVRIEIDANNETCSKYRPHT